jgi:hypothetical protein
MPSPTEAARPMRISWRAGATWTADGAEEPRNSEIGFAATVSGEGAVSTEAMLGKFLGGWRRAHPYASLYLEENTPTTSDPVLSVIY